MWSIFKIINLWWLLTSTLAWPMLSMPQMLLLIVANLGMLIPLSFQPINFSFGAKTGWVVLAIVALTLWATWLDGWASGVIRALQFMPVLYLLQLPYEYLKDLLKFTTKWYAILLIPGFVIYFLTWFIPLPSLGTFEHDGYMPFTNYGFYIKTTYDGLQTYRYNAFFLEPGHQSIASTFLLMANRFDFKKFKWLIILGVAVVFSFSLAGYLLAIIGFLLLKVNSIRKGLLAFVFLGGVVAAGLLWSGGENTLNEMIISRLEYDETSGIKGNNRFFNNTDFEYGRVIGTKYFWTSVKGHSNMELISGAGYKIYILHYGMIGTLLALFLYLSLIPSRPDYRFSISFFIVIALCFLQRAYPYWYCWLFPYVVGIYIAKYEKDQRNAIEAESNQELFLS